mgnify:FL=1
MEMCVCVCVCRVNNLAPCRHIELVMQDNLRDLVYDSAHAFVEYLREQTSHDCPGLSHQIVDDEFIIPPLAKPVSSQSSPVSLLVVCAHIHVTDICLVSLE